MNASYAKISYSSNFFKFTNFYFFRTTERKMMLEHIMHEKRLIPDCKCDICWKPPSLGSYQNKHFHRYLDGDKSKPSQYRCKQCKKQFSRGYDFLMHIKKCII